MATYTSAIALAARLIAAKGGPCTLVVEVPSTAPADPWDTLPPDTEQTLDCQGVFLSFSSNSYGQTFAGGDVIQANDRKVLIAAKDLAFAPNLKGRLIRKLLDGSTENWAIAGIRPLEPNGEQIMYTLQVRR